MCSLLFCVSCKKERAHNVHSPIDAITINNLIKEVINEINNNYADEITKERLEEGAINGMLSFLDEHSLYVSQEEFEAFYKSARGAYLGIGMEIKQVKDGIEVASIIEDSPAFNSGLKIADIITHINGNSVNNMKIKDVYSKLNNDAGLKISLSVFRNKTDAFEVTLKKSIVQMKTVKLDFVKDIAIVKINYFNDDTIDSVSSAVKKAKQHKVSGVILDLRNNPGGILDQAIGVANMFLNHGKIVDLKSKNIDDSRSVYATDSDILDGTSMAVIIDKNSASGAELVAAALGENKRAVIIGEKSYGKGALQTIIPIPGKGAIKLTTAFMLTPNGNKISHEGITPDIIIDTLPLQQNSLDYVLQRAIDLLRGISALDVIKK